MLQTAGRHYVAFVADAGPNIASVMVDGFLCDGGAVQAAGFTWFTALADVNGAADISGDNCLYRPRSPTPTLVVASLSPRWGPVAHHLYLLTFATGEIGQYPISLGPPVLSAHALPCAPSRCRLRLSRPDLLRQDIGRTHVYAHVADIGAGRELPQQHGNASVITQDATRLLYWHTY